MLLSGYRTRNVNDIQYIASEIRGRAYFQNIGKTRRQGLEATLSARNGGWMNANEIRYRQNMNPIDDERAGTVYWMPINMGDAGKEPVIPANEPIPDAEPDEDSDDAMIEENADAQ